MWSCYILLFVGSNQRFARENASACGFIHVKNLYNNCVANMVIVPIMNVQWKLDCVGSQAVVTI